MIVTLFKYRPVLLIFFTAWDLKFTTISYESESPSLSVPFYKHWKHQIMIVFCEFQSWQPELD